jgi:hypothetical protein
MCVLYAFSKHEEQTLVRSERANAGEKKIEEREKKKGTRPGKMLDVSFFLLLIIQFILSFCLYFFLSLAMEMELGYLLSTFQ